MRALILADDLTGALECGALFANSVVSVSAAVDDSWDVVVVDTGTRHAGAQEAAERVRALTERAQVELIYKKTDSTLRGPIGAELAALPAGVVHYAPAYPRMGRTVLDGVLLVDGVPVSGTAFARDPLDPVVVSRVRDVVGELARVRIYDGETDEDIRRVAELVMREPAPRLAAGPGALAGALAESMGMGPAAGSWPVIGEALVINGSAHPSSAAQMARISALPAWRAGRPEQALDAPGALVVFGGDTARLTLGAFGDPLLHPVGEVLRGVPLSWFEFEGRVWWMATKAGGFGGADLLERLHETLNRSETERGVGR